MKLIFCLLALLSVVQGIFAQTKSRPNILWFVVDDLSANFSCYGETAILTPHVDKMAAEGIKFTRAYATSRFAPFSFTHYWNMPNLDRCTPSS